MGLIFNDTLLATDTSGVYTLQALIGGTWTDIHSIAGAQNGSITIDASVNTIPVDTTLLQVGQTYQFRWVDTIGNESNIVTALVPYLILDYYAASEDITYTNNGGDSWTFNIPYSPPPNDLADSLYNQIFFYSDTGVTTLINQPGVTSNQSYQLSGNGAGTYMVEALYLNNQQAHISIVTAFLMVDGSGNVLRQLFLSGFSGVSFTGMNLSCTANYQITNASIEEGVYFTFDSSFNNQQVVALTNPLVNQQLPVYTTTELIVAYGIQLDPSEWTTGVAAQGNLVGCVMTLMTNIS